MPHALGPHTQVGGQGGYASWKIARVGCVCDYSMCPVKCCELGPQISEAA